MVAVVFLVWFFGVGSVYGEELKVMFTNVKPNKGYLMVSLVDGEKSWKRVMGGKSGGKGVVALRVKVGGEKRQEVVIGGLSLEGLREGKYGVIAYQDVDGDEKLKQGLFGIPQEPVGVSNDTVTLGPPKFEDARIRLKEGEGGIEVVLR
jgi:uncharacterized protein (DUF2141 family)